MTICLHLAYNATSPMTFDSSCGMRQFLSCTLPICSIRSYPTHRRRLSLSFNSNWRLSFLLYTCPFSSNVDRGATGPSEDGALRRRHPKNGREFSSILHRREQESSGTASGLQRQQISPGCMSRIACPSFWLNADNYRL